MPEFRIVPATRTTGTVTKHGWAVERQSAGDMPVVVTDIFETLGDAKEEAARLASKESVNDS